MITIRFTRTMVAAAVAGMALSALSSVVCADEAPQLKFVHGQFEPTSFEIPADKAFKLSVTNQDASAIEFESFELNRERVVGPGETITVNLPKLDPGQYHFFDDFHHEVAQGTITAK